MTNEDKKLFDALKIIKEECNRHTGNRCCENCSLGNDDGKCRITKTGPYDWNLRYRSVKRMFED